jgi:hypothetical protein
VDKHKVKAILAPYSPPLSSSQVDAIATEIAETDTVEIDDLLKKLEAPKPAHKKSRKSKSLCDREYSGRTEETAT